MAKTLKASRSSSPVAEPIPPLILLVDKNLVIKELNAAAGEFFGPQYGQVLRIRSGDALGCEHNDKTTAGCGHGRFCKICPVREAATLAHREQRVVRRRTSAGIENPKQRREINLLVTATPVPCRGATRVLLVLEDITALVQLHAPAPICASCKRIRDDQPYWEQLGTFLNEHLDLDLSSGVCGECKQQLYGGLKKSLPLFFKPRAARSKRRRA
jgi:hypothetical protein